MKKVLFYTALLFLLLFNQGVNCSDPDEPEPPKELPPITTEGKNTMGCKINGVVWTAYSKSVHPSFVADVDADNTKYASIVGNQYEASGLTQLMSLNFRPVDSTGQVFVLNNDPFNIAHYSFYSNGQESKTFKTTALHNGQVEILKYDKVNQIIAGTFGFTAVDTLTNDTLRITDGRFDMYFEK